MFNLTDAEKSTILRTMLRVIDIESKEYEALISAIVTFDMSRWEKERREQELREMFDLLDLMRLNSKESVQEPGGWIIK